MIEKRKYLRVPYQAPIYGNVKFVSELRDISISGCFISTNTKLTEGTIVDLEFTLPNTHRIVHARGEVRWFGKYSSDRRIEHSQGVGLKFIDMPLEDIALITEFVKHRASDRREFSRSNVTVPIRYSTDKKNLSNVGEATDLSLGGVFIHTQIPLQLDEILFLEIELPDTDGQIECSGKVVYINEKIPEIFRGLILPGMGIEFMQIADKDMEKLDQFLETSLEEIPSKKETV